MKSTAKVKTQNYSADKVSMVKGLHQKFGVRNFIDIVYSLPFPNLNPHMPYLN